MEDRTGESLNGSRSFRMKAQFFYWVIVHSNSLGATVFSLTDFPNEVMVCDWIMKICAKDELSNDEPTALGLLVG